MSKSEFEQVMKLLQEINEKVDELLHPFSLDDFGVPEILIDLPGLLPEVE